MGAPLAEPPGEPEEVGKPVSVMPVEEWAELATERVDFAPVTGCVQYSPVTDELILLARPVEDDHAGAGGPPPSLLCQADGLAFVERGEETKAVDIVEVVPLEHRALDAERRHGVEL